MKLLNRVILKLSVILLAAVGFSENSNAKFYSYTHACMGTEFKLLIHSNRPAREVKEVALSAFRLADRLDNKFSDYSAESEVSKFNEFEANVPFKLSRDLLGLLITSKQFHAKTNNAFEPASGALTRLWRLSKRTGTSPKSEDLISAIEASSSNNLLIDKKNKTLTKTNKLTRLDFGGIAKGLAADKMMHHLKKSNFDSCSISAGGDIIVGSPPPGKKFWKVKIRPYGNSIIGEFNVNLSNAAVSTSGSIEQSVTINEKKYSHIINPKKGLGLESNISVTVISKKATTTDALATSICILGKDGLEILQNYPETEASIIDLTKEGTLLIKSEGFSKYLD